MTQITTTRTETLGVEQTYGRDGSKAEVLKEAWVYAPTFLKDEPHGTDECSLFVRRYRLLKMPSGRLLVRWKQDVETFPDEEAMAVAIEAQGMTEQPEDQPDSDWIPAGVMP